MTTLNRSSHASHYSKVAGMGLLTGIRALAGPALVAPYLAGPARRVSLFKFRKPPRYPKILRGLALAEMIGDKFPAAPDRTSPRPLAMRALAGAVTGAFTSRALGRGKPFSFVFGAMTGGLAAVAGAYGAFHLRRWLTAKDIVPSFLVGLFEDALVTNVGGRILAGPA